MSTDTHYFFLIYSEGGIVGGFLKNHGMMHQARLLGKIQKDLADKTLKEADQLWKEAGELKNRKNRNGDKIG